MQRDLEGTASMIGLACTIAIVTGSGVDQERPVAPRLESSVPAVDLGTSDGCARFQVRFDAEGQPLIETVYGTSHCPAQGRHRAENSCNW
jgi:hypothetical protein